MEIQRYEKVKTDEGTEAVVLDLHSNAESGDAATLIYIDTGVIDLELEPATLRTLREFPVQTAQEQLWDAISTLKRHKLHTAPQLDEVYGELVEAHAHLCVLGGKPLPSEDDEDQPSYQFHQVDLEDALALLRGIIELRDTPDVWLAIDAAAQQLGTGDGGESE